MRMVAVIGFGPEDEAAVRRLHRRMAAEGFPLEGLSRVEKRDMDGYNGLVVPSRTEGGAPLSCVLYLSLAAPFTIAHELAHVADIAARHDETLTHLAAGSSKAWHLAHRLSSEYFANRIATLFCSDPEIFPAFQNDRMGLIKAARDGQWADVLINYAMLLGIFHGLKRLDIEPLELLPDSYLDSLPDSVLTGMAGFRREADSFFQGHQANLVPA
ncbi:MAG TPA: hypothetical protein VL974_13860 [Magnetospirillum sp.]|nr:hypothetical protein [Magnetospirillum sp.]